MPIVFDEVTASVAEPGQTRGESRGPSTPSPRTREQERKALREDLQRLHRREARLRAH